MPVMLCRHPNHNLSSDFQAMENSSCPLTSARFSGVSWQSSSVWPPLSGSSVSSSPRKALDQWFRKSRNLEPPVQLTWTVLPTSSMVLLILMGNGPLRTPGTLLDIIPSVAKCSPFPLTQIRHWINRDIDIPL